MTSEFCRLPVEVWEGYYSPCIRAEGHGGDCTASPYMLDAPLEDEPSRYGPIGIKERAVDLMAIGPVRLVRLVIELQDRIAELERA